MYNLKGQKVFLKIFIMFFVFVELFGFIFNTQTVQAQEEAAAMAAAAATAAATPGMPTKDTGTQTLIAAKSTADTVKSTLLTAALGGLVNMASYVARKVSYDLAMFISTGGHGQGALAFKQNFSSYIVGIAENSAASLINQLGKPFGLDMCQTPDLKLQAFLQVGLRQKYKQPSKNGSGNGTNNENGPQPDCTFQQMQGAWTTGMQQKYGADGSKFADQLLANSIKTSNDDFSLALGAQAQIDRLQATEVAGATSQRLEAAGFKPLTDLISGNIKTPGDIIKTESTALTAKEKGKESNQQIAGIYGAASAQILPMAGSVFLNTLVSQLLNKLLSKGLFDSSGSGAGEQAPVLNSYTSEYVAQTQQAVANAFSFFYTAVPNKSFIDYGIVTKFSSCDLSSNDPDNCVMDLPFATAVNRGSNGAAAMTIRQAMDKKEDLLHADWPLISPSRVSDNTDKNCYSRGYCYSNLQKLRKARIIPLGFELAAFKADPHNLAAWTLKTVVDNYDNCYYVNGKVEISSDPVYQYCHLIDPNWLLKSPEAVCESAVIGERTQSSGLGTRQTECADLSTCIKEDNKGGCLGGYHSYCLKEGNIWRLDAPTCPSYYNTCKTYTAIDGTTPSYLSRTVDYGQCTANDVGCTAYSQEQVGDSWLPSSKVQGLNYQLAGRNQVSYFNKNFIADNNICDAANDGCSSFYPAILDGDGAYVNNYDTGALVYIKKAPDYLGCYNIDPRSANKEIVWPQTKPELALLPTEPRCDNFSRACLPEEVGCLAYQPKDGGQMIPGVAEDINKCAANCVGYNTFKQESTDFEPQKFPLYFVPIVAQTNMVQGKQICSKEFVGCDEFTNIDAAAAGGEGLEYYSQLRYCERPTGSNEGTFYSWEGSKQEGYVLRTHKMLKINADKLLLIKAEVNSTIWSGFPLGSPAYVDYSPEKMINNNYICNALAYNNQLYSSLSDDAPNCRALYNSNGEVFYRLLSETVTVDPACHPLRKTAAHLYSDSLLKESRIDFVSPSCADEQGYWDRANNTCQRCYNGGQYASSTCIYWTISRPGESLSCNGPADNLAEFNGCRAYKGNNGNSPRNVFEIDDFETTSSLSLWSGVTLSPESIYAGGHSLEIKDDVNRQLPAGSLNNQGWYELSFWARGTSQNIEIYFKQATDKVGAFTYNQEAQTPLSVTIGSEWQNYHFGPVEFTGASTTPAQLYFGLVSSPGVGGSYYIDNVRLTEVPGNIYLIKDSWKSLIQLSTGETFWADAPGACFGTTDEDLGNAKTPYPGKALGCKAYIDVVNSAINKQNVEANLTGFAKMCRPEAVGCTAVYDSHNRISGNPLDQQIQLYNAECRLTSTTPKCSFTVGDNGTYGCTVLPGEDRCFVQGLVSPTGYTQAPVSVPDYYTINPAFDHTKGIIHFNSFHSGGHTEPTTSTDTGELYVVTSTIVIPADTSDHTPIFLTTYNLASSTPLTCTQAELGCQKFGQENHILPNSDTTSYQFSDVYYKNNPANYLTNDTTGIKGTLCRSGLLGCSGYTYGANTFYFKDPLQTGNSLCYYKQHDPINPTQAYGWFKKDIGYCSSGSAQLCRVDDDCGQGNSCQKTNPVPCYDNYLQNNIENGIWSNGNTSSYKGNVGECDEANNACTELLDTVATSAQDPTGKPYYVIYSQDLVDQASDQINGCNNKVGETRGCVLFNRTEDPNKIYNSGATYANSAATKPERFLPVPPVTTGQLDTNLLLKVRRDRECSEWLSCRTSFDLQTETGKTIKYCSDFGLCNQTTPDGYCNNFLPTTNNNLLDEAFYVGRAVGWAEPDYSGYSLLNRYNLATDRAVSFPSSNKLYLVHSDSNNANCIDSSGNSIKGICGIDNGGRCYNGSCIYPLDGPFADVGIVDINTGVEKAVVSSAWSKSICKSHPEATSPFPESLVVDSKVNDAKNGVENGKKWFKNTPDKGGWRAEFTNIKNDYKGVNVCQANVDCSCQYEKINYKGVLPDYWPDNSTLKNPFDVRPQGICTGGNKDGFACLVDTDCNSGDNTNGVCAQESSIDKYKGTTGYCLENDLSHPLGTDSTGKIIFPCLTWLPLDLAGGTADNINGNPNLGYTTGIDANPSIGEVYCTNSTAPLSYEKSYWKNFGMVNLYGLLTPIYENFSDINQKMEKDGKGNGLIESYFPPRENPSKYDNNSSVAGRFEWCKVEPIPVRQQYITCLAYTGTPGVCYEWVENIKTECFGQPNHFFEPADNAFVQYLAFRTQRSLRAFDPSKYDPNKEWSEEFSKKNSFDPKANFLNDPSPEVEAYANLAYDYLNKCFVPSIFQDSNVNSALDCTDKNTKGHFISMFDKDNFFWMINPFTEQICNDTSTFQYGDPQEDYTKSVLGWCNNNLSADSFSKKVNSSDKSNTFYTYLQTYSWLKISPTAQVLLAHDPVKWSEKETVTCSSSGSCAPTNLMGFGDSYFNDFTGVASKPYVATKKVNEKDLKALYLAPYSYKGTRFTGSDRSFALIDNVKIDVDRLRSLYLNPPEPNSIDRRSPNWSYVTYTFLLDFSSAHLNIHTTPETPRNVTAVAFYAKNKNDNHLVIGVVVDDNDQYEGNPSSINSDRFGSIISNELECPNIESTDSGLAVDTANKYNNLPSGLDPGKDCGVQTASAYEGSLNGFYRATLFKFDSDNNLDLSTFESGYKDQVYDNIAFNCYAGFGCSNPSYFNSGWSAKLNNNFIALAKMNRGKALFSRSEGGTFSNPVNSLTNNNLHALNHVLYPYLGVIADLYPRCTEYVQVYNENQPISYSGIPVSNKAWTNRVWKNAADVLTLKLAGAATTTLLNNTSVSRPFGNLSLKGSDLVHNQDSIIDYNFMDPAAAGYPFVCSQILWATDSLINVAASYYLGCSGLMVPILDANGQTVTSAADNTASPYYNVITGLGTLNGVNGREILHQLFAKEYYVVKRNDNTLKLVSGGDVDVAASNSGVFAKLLPPQIYSLNLVNCLPSSNTSGVAVKCTPWMPNTFTVNKNNGLPGAHYAGDTNVFEEDLNKNGLTDADNLVGIGTYNAMVEFYGFADENRMPLRRLMIDWGDDLPIYGQGISGYYFNNKPICESNDDGGNFTVKHCLVGNKDKQITCNDNSDCLGIDAAATCGRLPNDTLQSFGDIMRTCRANYFKIEHGYACDNQTATTPVNSLDEDQKKIIREKSPSAIMVCVFQPKVQLMDNWGWCNCNDPKGCYGDDSSKNCDPTKINAWTYFQSKIIVIPNEKKK